MRGDTAVFYCKGYGNVPLCSSTSQRLINDFRSMEVRWDHAVRGMVRGPGRRGAQVTQAHTGVAGGGGTRAGTPMTNVCVWSLR